MIIIIIIHTCVFFVVVLLVYDKRLIKFTFVCIYHNTAPVSFFQTRRFMARKALVLSLHCLQASQQTYIYQFYCFSHIAFDVSF